jgi:hypothetical protein
LIASGLWCSTSSAYFVDGKMAMPEWVGSPIVQYFSLVAPHFLQLLIGAFLIATACLGFTVLSNLMFVKSTVFNVTDRNFFTAFHVPRFISQSPASSRIQQFRSLTNLTVEGATDLGRATEVLHFVHRQQPQGRSWEPHRVTFSERLRGDIDDPIRLLKSIRNGAPATCRNFSFLMVAALTCIEMHGRVVIFNATYWKSGTDGHMMMEVWVPSLAKWVLMDAMWDVVYCVDGIPASAFEVYEAAQLSGVAQIRLAGEQTCLTLGPDKRRMFRHLYTSMSNALFDGYGVRFFGNKRIAFAHFANRYSRPFPVKRYRLGVFLSSAAFLLGLAVFSVGLFNSTRS